ncbi:SPFH domain-containing protein [Streptomyces sp. cmx-10-25]|uniref:SPFH domain-containing protein n=1 Tax=Streptomyces sp. cmx-10-25 TaxID=2790919 RepID=UPI003980257A
MTAPTPTPADSGAAASRDAARTARRLTDGTLPRTSPPRTPPGDLLTPPAPPVSDGATVQVPEAPVPDGPAVRMPEPPAAPAADVPPNRDPEALATAAPAEPDVPATDTSPDRVAGAPANPVAGTPVSPTADKPTPPVAGVSLVRATAAPVAEAPSEPGGGAPESRTVDAPAAPTPDAPSVRVTVAPVAAPTAVTAREKTPASPQEAATPVTPVIGVTPVTPVTPATKAPTPTKAPAQAGTTPAPTKAPAPEPATAPTRAPAPEPAPTPTPDPPGGTTAPDFGRIKGARVAVVALPVAGVVRVARRRNVIGAETTGSIPVHLLFRDEPETGTPGAKDDDGGPDTVAMAPPTAPGKTRGPGVPGPAKTPAPGRTERAPAPRPRTVAKSRARHAAPPPSSRPAPTADPALVERPGAVLPGWVGVVGGALALAWCAVVVWWTGAVPDEAARMLRLPVRPYHGVHLGQWALLALGIVAVLFALGGLGRGRVGYAWVLTLFGDYRGTVRRTGLIWVSPLLLRRRVDVRLRHWRSEPLPAVDARGTALDVVVLVVWRVRDTVRASLGIDGHEEYLREQVEAAMARVLSQLPADAFHEDAPTLRDAEAVGEALTRMLSAECAPVGLDVFSAQPTRIEYAPEVATAMRRSRIAALDAKHRDSVLTSVVDAVDDVVHRLTSRGLVELDDYERKALVKDLTVAFYTGRASSAEGA